MNTEKKTIKIKFTDGLDPENDLVFLPILKKHYNVVFSENPDYLIYSVFGKEHLKYDCIKIFTTGEAVIPNFNECDYAHGFDFIDFGDRYIRLPLCSIMFRYGVNMIDLAYERGKNLPEVKDKKFCSFVVSNENGFSNRRKMFEILSEYKTVDSGGSFLNNVGGRVKNKLYFEHEHKFSICFENEIYPGYTTEKLVDAFAAGTIPIYLGDPRVGEYFNTKAFINVMDFASLEDAAEYVKKVDNDDDLYKSIMEEPICIKDPPGLAELEKYLLHIFDQNIEDAKRRPTSSLAKAVERQELSRLERAIRKVLK